MRELLVLPSTDQRIQSWAAIGLEPKVSSLCARPAFGTLHEVCTRCHLCLNLDSQSFAKPGSFAQKQKAVNSSNKRFRMRRAVLLAQLDASVADGGLGWLPRGGCGAEVAQQEQTEIAQ